MPSSGWTADSGPGLRSLPAAFGIVGNAQAAVQLSLLDLGSNFLERAGNQATWGTNVVLGSNPGGGGASQDTAPLQFRSWAEAYGASARADPQGAFAGDHRTTYGGVAGFGATLLPGLNVGVTIDQSQSSIDIPLASQTATLGLTQIGFNASYTFGAWTLAGVIVHGLGDISADRTTRLGPTLSHYGGGVDGGLGELSYYWGFGESRIVPKLGFEYVRAATDPFREIGGLAPVAISAVSGERATVLVGAELGHYWVINGHVLDVSGYGKFIDNVMQTIDPTAITFIGRTLAIQGILESQYGADAGAGVSYGISQAWRVYANYDGKFRGNFVSHTGTLGVEYKW